MGIEKKKRNMVHNELEHLAGTWSAQDAVEFESVTAVFQKVDEHMWR